MIEILMYHILITIIIKKNILEKFLKNVSRFGNNNTVRNQNLYFSLKVKIPLLLFTYKTFLLDMSRYKFYILKIKYTIMYNICTLYNVCKL